MAEIRKARPEDVEDIQTVFYQTWLATYPNEEAGITREDIEFRWKDAFSEERLTKRRDELKDPASEPMFVAIEDGKIVGICRVEREAGANRIAAIYVLPEYQGAGIGKGLFFAAEEYLGREKDMLVGVATYNTNAIAFYTKMGFVDTGRRFAEERHRMKSGANIPQMEMTKLGTISKETR